MENLWKCMEMYGKKCQNKSPAQRRFFFYNFFRFLLYGKCNERKSMENL